MNTFYKINGLVSEYPPLLREVAGSFLGRVVGKTYVYSYDLDFFSFVVYSLQINTSI